jgi:hypothetical protein
LKNTLAYDRRRRAIAIGNTVKKIGGVHAGELGRVSGKWDSFIAVHRTSELGVLTGWSAEDVEVVA